MRSWDPRGAESRSSDIDYGSSYYGDEYDGSEYYNSSFDAPRRAGAVVRAGRVVSGVVCGAVIVLTVVVCVAQYLAGRRDVPGPGTDAVAAHVVATVVAIVAQLVADRRRGAMSLLAACVGIFTASILMFTQWWG